MVILYSIANSNSVAGLACKAATYYCNAMRVSHYIASFRKFPKGRGGASMRTRGAGHLSVCMCISISARFLEGSGGMLP